MSALKLGLVTYNIAKDWDLETIIEVCEKTGFKGVELRTTHAHNVESDLSSEERREVKLRFDDSPVQLVGLGSVFEYHSLDQSEVRKNIEGTKEYVKLAHDVGARGVKVRPNGDQVDRGIPREQTLDQIGKALKECGDFAKDYGIDIRLEMHGSVADAKNIARIMDAAGDGGNVSVCWNSNEVDVKNNSIKTSFAYVKDKISLVHLHELWEHEFNTYPYRELFALLQEEGYEGFCLAEIPASDQPERLMKYYKALFEALQ